MRASVRFCDTDSAPLLRRACQERLDARLKKLAAAAADSGEAADAKGGGGLLRQLRLSLQDELEARVDALTQVHTCV